MLFRTPRWALVAALVVAWPAVAAAQYTIKEAESAPPKQLDKAVSDLLGPKSVQFLNKDELVAELWFRKEVPVTATPQQLEKGLTYEQIAETTLMGAIRIDKPVTDYRKQKIKPGVYTLRLGMQPMDGDHMGTAPDPYFLLVSPAAEDKKPGPMKDPKDLQDLSTKATGGSHPGVFLLVPVKDPGAEAKLVTMPGNNWVLEKRLDATAKGQKGTLIIGLTLVGVSSAA
jgi:hypothetical protein